MKNLHESSFFEKNIVLEIDEHLRGPGVRPAGREDEGPTGVELFHRVVLDARVAILGIERGIPRQAELANEVWNDAEEARFIVESPVQGSKMVRKGSY